jgi:hypothetical protein
MSEPKQGLTHDTPAIYRIRLQGELDERLSEYLEMSVSVAQGIDGLYETILSGWLVDQAALLGVLNNMYDMGFPILSVESLDVDIAESSECDKKI